MRETFYEQCRSEGVLISTYDYKEEWVVRGNRIAVYFSNVEHTKILQIVL